MSTTDAAKPSEAQTPVDDLAIESDPQPQPSAPKPSAPEQDEAEIAETERQPT